MQFKDVDNDGLVHKTASLDVWSKFKQRLNSRFYLIILYGVVYQGRAFFVFHNIHFIRNITHTLGSLLNENLGYRPIITHFLFQAIHDHPMTINVKCGDSFLIRTLGRSINRSVPLVIYCGSGTPAQIMSAAQLWQTYSRTLPTPRFESWTGRNA